MSKKPFVTQPKNRDERLLEVWRHCHAEANQTHELVRSNMHIKEFFGLVWTNLKVTGSNMIEFVKTAFSFYHSFAFFKADMALRMMYLFHSPYKISKRFLMNRGSHHIYAYGETPLSSLQKIADTCKITAHDCVFELGAGRGKTCFWLNTIIGCKVVGIEYVPEFVERAQLIVNKLHMNHIEFRCEDMFSANLSGGSVYYLYGTCLDDEEIRQMASRLEKLPKGTRIITVSYPLTDYKDDGKFEVLKCFQVPFTWGKGDVYLQVVY